MLETSDGFVFCPSRDEILLRVSEEDISPVQNLPVPGTYYMFIFERDICHKVNNKTDARVNGMKSLLPMKRTCHDINFVV